MAGRNSSHDSSRAGVRQAHYAVIPLEMEGALYDINRFGDAVGHAVDATGTMRAVLTAGGEMVDLGTLGGSAAAARGINGEGVIVGGSLTAGDATHHAFIYEHGAMRDLNALISPELDCELIYALGINDRGDVLAIGNFEGSDRVLLLKKEPNPTTDSS